MSVVSQLPKKLQPPDGFMPGERDLLYSIYVLFGGNPNMITKLPNNQPASVRDLLYSIFINLPTGSGSGGGITFSAGVPAGGDGAVGDTRVNTTTGILYEKTGIATWTARGQFAKSVTNTDAVFTTPSAGDKAATLG